MSTIHKAELTVFADYHQFYLADAGTHWLAPEDWTDEDLLHGAKATEHVLVICPARNMNVPVLLEVLDHRADIEFSSADHVVEASLHLPTGQLQLAECTGNPEKLKLTLTPGWYRVQARFFNLERAWEGDSGDAYELLLWPESQHPLVVHKQWKRDWRG